MLLGAFPADRFLGEETGLTGADETAPSWIVDPLDGTANFVRGFPHWAVSIARTRGGLLGSLEAGVVWDPVKKDLFAAEAGAGAFRNGQRLRVPPRQGLEGAALATGFPFRQQHKIDLYLSIFRAVFLKSRSLRRAGSAALDLAYVAGGIFDGFFEFGLSPWDTAAGALLVDGGGRRPHGLRRRSVVADARQRPRRDARRPRGAPRGHAGDRSRREGSMRTWGAVLLLCAASPALRTEGADWFDAFRGRAFLQGDASFIAREASAPPDSPPLFRARWVVLRVRGVHRDGRGVSGRTATSSSSRCASGARFVLESSLGFVDESHLEEEHDLCARRIDSDCLRGLVVGIETHFPRTRPTPRSATGVTIACGHRAGRVPNSSVD